MERRLATILAIDVVGYSRLMRKDEEGTLARLIEVRHLLDQLAADHGGRTFGAAGDSVLAEFSSPVEAVRCSVNIQHDITETNANRPKDTRMHLRIGVNVGDVMDENGTLYGDGINVAARLESLSEAGGMCISGAVYEHVRDRVDLTFRDVGEQVVKNIDRPVQAWKWSPSNQVLKYDNSAQHLNEKPSIAVLAFENMSGNSEHEYFADGISEEIITTLSKVPNLHVVARHSTFTYKGQSVDVKQISAEQDVRYVLEGSVRTAGKRVRITAQLIDAANSHHIWADRYDRNIDDIFELQDEIALKVVTELRVKLTEGEMARLRGAGTKSVEAWEQQIRANACTNVPTRQSYIAARQFAMQAASLDPSYSAPLCTLGLINTVEARHGFSASRSVSISEARRCAAQSLALDPLNAEAHSVLGLADSLEGHHAAAMGNFKRALEINPNHAEITARFALTLTFDEQADEGIRTAKRAMRLCPKPPDWYVGILGFALRVAGRYDEAIETFHEYSHLVKGFGHVDLTIIHILKNEIETARNEADEVLRYRPGFTISSWAATQLYTDKKRLKMDEDALRQAGLPE